MNRRDFSGAGLATVAIAGLGTKAFAQSAGDAPSGGHHHADDAMMACAKACSDCQRECDSCSAHCSQRTADGKKEHLVTVKTCQDCADICVAAAQIISRGGPFATTICTACAEACGKCGEACEKFPDDAHMKRCAEECRKCEKACREMVKHA